jgi:8-oxo-dGTP pyrophosphatase MutT (NUDIX family)
MKLISSEKLLETPIFSVTQDRAVDPDGFEIKRAIVQHVGSAVMMPVDDKNRILLVRQYRLPARASLWELPAGRVDKGESLLQAAKRELREETGFKAKKWTKLTSFFVSPGFLAEKMTIFVASDLTEGEKEPMEDERIELKWFRVKELDDMIGAGKIQDAKTMVGFLTWKRYHARKK